MQYLRQEIFTLPFLFSLFPLSYFVLVLLPFRLSWHHVVKHVVTIPARSAAWIRWTRCMSHTAVLLCVCRFHAGCREGRLAISVSTSSQNKMATTTLNGSVLTYPPFHGSFLGLQVSHQLWVLKWFLSIFSSIDLASDWSHTIVLWNTYWYLPHSVWYWRLSLTLKFWNQWHLMAESQLLSKE